MAGVVICVMLLIGGACAVNNFFPNPPFDPPPTKKCYECSKFNDQGQGFVEYPDHVWCCYYYECWRIQVFTDAPQLQGHLMPCPNGTWFDPINGPLGAPCGPNKPYPECVNFCPPFPPFTPDLKCYLWPEPGKPWIFGTWTPEPAGPDGPFTPDMFFRPVGQCVHDEHESMVFDHESCTCIGPPEPNFCYADILLNGTFEDYSPMRGDVIVSGGPVVFVPGFVPWQDEVGRFEAGFLNDQLFSGLYAGCWVKKLTVRAFFLAYDATRPTMQGVVSHASCPFVEAPEPISFAILVGRGTVVAKLGSYEVSYPIISGTWYYVAFTYQMRARKDNLKLYVYSIPEYETCQTRFICPGPVASVDTFGACIEPRPCGLDIGFIGSSADPDEFFFGLIAGVQVYHGVNIIGCPPPGLQQQP